VQTSLVVHHVRSGIAALNVVSAALDADVRTSGIDVRFARSREETARAISPFRSIVAWSFYSTDFAAAASDLAWVRRSRPCALASTSSSSGEGEATFVEIVSALKSGADPRALAGTAHLDGDRLVTHGPGPRRPLDDFPAYNLRYGKWNAIEITRGCVYACSFCQTPYMFKARFRHRSVENVRMHVRAMSADGSRFQRFVSPTSLSYGSDDETPNLDAVDALLAAVREEVGPDGKIYFGTFPSEVRPEHVTPAALAILKRWVDNTSLVIGGQSGSERVLRETRRGHGVDDVVRAVEASIAAGFRPDVDFLLGVPGETREDRDASLRLAEKLVRMGARIHSHAFLPLPGTPLRNGVPEEIEPTTRLAMERLESRGAMYGQWRKQVVAAEELVRRRRHSASREGMDSAAHADRLAMSKRGG
jgi:B12-binding domain/radical SAM domain protein